LRKRNKFRINLERNPKSEILNPKQNPKFQISNPSPTYILPLPEGGGGLRRRREFPSIFFHREGKD